MDNIINTIDITVYPPTMSQTRTNRAISSGSSGLKENDTTFSDLTEVRGLTSLSCKQNNCCLVNLKYGYWNHILLEIGSYQNASQSGNCDMTAWQGATSGTETVTKSVSAKDSTETTTTFTFTHNVKCVKSIATTDSSARQKATIKMLSISGKNVTVVATNSSGSSTSQSVSYSIEIYY